MRKASPANPKVKDDLWVKTACNICFCHCAIRAHRVNGVVVKIEGNPDCPTTRGGICPRGASGLMLLYDPNAISGGRVAGANLSGGQAEYEGGIPTAALNFFGNTAFSLGLAALQDGNSRVVKQFDNNAKKFNKLVFQGGRLVGAMFVNEKVDPGIISHLIKKRIDVSPHMEALFERTKPLSDPWLASLKFR